MTLNYSYRPLFPSHTSENNLWSPLRTADCCLAECSSDRYGEYHSRPWHASQEEMEDWNSIRNNRADRCCSPELNPRDIVDLLPSDPFGMDMQTTVTAITGWLEDLEVDYGGYVRSNSRRSRQESCDLFSGLNLIWSNALISRPFSSNFQSNEKLSSRDLSFLSSPQVYGKPDETLSAINKLDEYEEVKGMEGQSACKETHIMGFSEGTSCSPVLQFGEEVEGAARYNEAPHDAFKFCLMYLGVEDLLSVERVCRYLRSEVRGEPLLWKSIHIGKPLHEKITDDILFELVCRADGNLQSLSLVECPRITDDGIKRILETNPRLTKLFVPGCIRLTIDGIINNISTYNSNKDVSGIKFLRIGGICAAEREQFEELKCLLGTDDEKLESHHKLHFFNQSTVYLPYDDKREIDIKMCPRCEEFKLVYDCPSERCPVKDDASQVCRACILCISRCAHCGMCIYESEYQETFTLESLCSDCFKQFQMYQDCLDKKIDPCETHMNLIT